MIEYIEDGYKVIENNGTVARYKIIDSPVTIKTDIDETPVDDVADYQVIRTGDFYTEMGKVRYGEFITTTNTDLQYLKAIIDAQGFIDPNNKKVRPLLKAFIDEGILTKAQLTKAFDSI